MKGDFKRKICIDPLTGFPNFFKFVQANTIDVFSNNGSVIVFDIINFFKINNDYGKEVGDICLKALSEAIDREISSYEKTSAFRTDGDEFTVILPNVSKEEGENIAFQIREKWRALVKEHGLGDIDVHLLVLEYLDEIKSIDDFYKVIFKNSIKSSDKKLDKFSEEAWVENIISSFIMRIKDTLTLLNDTYNLALTDDISRLPNHRACKMYLDELMKMCMVNKKPFSILFIDGDNLKKYNDISYETGNDMIKDLSSIIFDSLRKNDRIFRWLTGDEFLLILEGVGRENSSKLAERVRLTVEEGTKDWVYPITVSIGVSSYPDDGTTINELIKKAEKANVEAKNTGKNRVVKCK